MTTTAEATPPPAVALEAAHAGRLVASGGIGSVWEAAPEGYADARPVVLKRFNRPEQVDARALEALVRWRRDLPPSERSWLDRITTWPLATVNEAGTCVGFVMHRVPREFAEEVRLPSGRRQSVLREAQYLIAPEDRLCRLRVPAPSRRTRLEIVWMLAEAIGFLHRRRIVVGDLSSRNVLWRPDPGRIVIVDCDSTTLGRVGSPHEPAFTVDWDDPAQPVTVAASSDVYKLALFALRTLARSFQTRDPAA
ncbi:MAG: phosphotransferase, partial [Actinomycetota bacterium]|nr:phosphotransferase [Actinomycetota bacterium]